MIFSKIFEFDAFGDRACFTRPELKVERVSYEIMTPSAARGLIEAVLWKPAIRWHIDAITLLRNPRWFAFRRNELKDARVSSRRSHVFIEDERTQRNTLGLQHVGFRVACHFEMTKRVGDADSIVKFETMFERRIRKGQHAHQPYLGCREFPAWLQPSDGEVPEHCQATRPLGLMFYDYLYQANPNGKKNSLPPRPLFFDARLERGVMRVPTFKEVLAFNEVKA